MKLLAKTYRLHLCGSEHPLLSEQMLELLVTNSDSLRKDLNTLCRFVLVMHGIEGHSAADCAPILGIPARIVEAAYCVAIEAIELYSFVVFATEAENMYAGS